MLRQPATGSRPPRDSAGLFSPDQSCSSDPGDVLIRSTRILPLDRRPEDGPAPASVHITVQKLRDSAPVPPQDPRTQTRRQKPPHKPDMSAAPRPAAAGRSGKSPDRWNKQTKENREPTPRPPPPQRSPNMKTSAGSRSEQQPGHDLLTSRFTAGGRGVVFAALRQRAHSAPCRREVPVTVLDLQPSSQHAPAVSSTSQDEALMEAELPARHIGDAATAAAAAATAAAMAATAPLIRVQSEMASRVSQLSDDVQQLLQTDREGGARGRSLSQQQLETVQSCQLQLQSQLLESALRIVTGHAHVTSDLTASGQLQVTHLDTAENVLGNRHRGSTATGVNAAAAAAVETGPVAMATPTHDRWTEQSRGNRRRGAHNVSTHSSANHSDAAARRANETRRLKTNVNLTESEHDATTVPPTQRHRSPVVQPPPELNQDQQNQDQRHLDQQNQIRRNQDLRNQEQQKKSQQNQSQQNQYQQNQSQVQHQSQRDQFQLNQSQENQSQQNQPQQNQYQQNQTQRNQYEPSQSHQSLFQQNPGHFQSQSALVQKSPVAPSVLEEASRVLRQVRRQKKILEENLESLLRAKTGEILHCHLEALAANRDWTDEIRIKKTVDAWISTLSRDHQVEENDAAVTSQRASAGSSAHSGRGKPASALRGTGSRTGRGGRGQRAVRPHSDWSSEQGAEPSRAPGEAADGEEEESYLTRLYGRAPYDGLRRTLKKSPYLRLSSAPPQARKPRPRLVESVRGVKVKSCKTQTTLAPPPSLSPGRHHHHLTVGSSHRTSADSAHIPVPMAIPLGRRRMDSRGVAERQQEVTSPPNAPSSTNEVMESDDAAHQRTEQQDEDGAAPPLHQPPPPLHQPPPPLHQPPPPLHQPPPPLHQPPPPLHQPPPPPLLHHHHPPQTIEVKSDDDDVFPGTNFLSVADVVQEEVSVVGEEAVEVDGGPSPPPVLYQGPVFPPQAPPAPQDQDQYHGSVQDEVQQRDALENRLVEWVEQQLMSRMISEMYHPPPSDPAQDVSTDQSELEERSQTSDIVEAAGGAGLQLFVDSNVSVDSVLIRQLVNEVLTETVALMLGQREGVEPGPEQVLGLGPEPGPGQDEPGPRLVPTPEPTPPPSPTTPTKQATPPTTPPPSEPTSLLHQESPQPVTAPEPVATPTSSPDPALSADSPPVNHHQAPPTLTWGDAELPLDEERPGEHVDPNRQTLMMSVAEEEPPLSSPVPPPPSPPPPPSLPPPPLSSSPAPPSCSSDDSSSSSSSSSSSTVTTGTEAALRHISEGELLITVNQLTAATEEDGVVHSFSSSLQELQEMDFDPPSEGQVRGHDLLLTLLTKMEQGVTHTEGSWGREEQQQEEEVSVGEVRRTVAQRSRSLSPDHIGHSADSSTNQDAVTVGDLTVEPLATLTSDLSVTPDTHTAGQVGPVSITALDTQTADEEEEEGGTRRMDVHLPPVRVEEEEQVSAAVDTDSSNDVF